MDTERILSRIALSKGKKTSMTFRVPIELKNKLSDYCKANKVVATDLIKSLIYEFLSEVNK